MKKKGFLIYYVLLWLLSVVVYNLIIFLLPSTILGIDRFSQFGFWVGYSLVILAFIGQLICSLFVFSGNSLSKVFLAIPIIKIAYAALAISFIVGTVFMSLPIIPCWIASIVCLCLMFFYLIAVMRAVAVVGTAADVENSIAERTSFIRSATAQAEVILATAKTSTIKKDVAKVYEALQYSDPVSNKELAEIEEQIAEVLHQLKAAVEDDNCEEVSSVAKCLLFHIQERNTKCKLQK